MVISMRNKEKQQAAVRSCSAGLLSQQPSLLTAAPSVVAVVL